MGWTTLEERSEHIRRTLDGQWAYRAACGGPAHLLRSTEGDWFRPLCSVGTRLPARLWKPDEERERCSECEDVARKEDEA